MPETAILRTPSCPMRIMSKFECDHMESVITTSGGKILSTKNIYISAPLNSPNWLTLEFDMGVGQ